MKGFTIIELIVSIAIFAFMTALVISKYGTFNQNTLLVNVAYDMALTVRTAQSYGLSVKSVDGSSNNFNASYGVHFDMSDTQHFMLFVDKTKSGLYNSSDPTEIITTYALNSGAKISAICLASDTNSPCSDVSLANSDKLDITYRRPNPDAYFCKNGSGELCGNEPNSNNLITDKPIVFITITSSDGTNKQNVVIRKNGQISVGN